MNSMRLRPPRPPGNGCDRWRQRRRCCAQRRKFLYSGQNLFARRAARHRVCAGKCNISLHRQRFCDCVRAYPFFFLRRKKNSEKERPLRGFRREVRFIMSPPGKRRHNELNAAPPPETPRGTGKTGEVADRDNVHSGESFCIRGKSRLCCAPARHDHDFAFPSEGKVPEGRMRCRLRVAEPFTNEKVTLCSVTRWRATPHSSAPPPPSPQRGRLTVGFCFGDRDFMTASPGVYAILCSCKERLCQESTLRGFRREVRFIMSPPGKRRHNELNAAPPPETPRRTGATGGGSDGDATIGGKRCLVRAKAV